MTIFNRQGVEFAHLVKVPVDPNGPAPTYSFKFPALRPNGTVVERWGSRVRPIKDMTRILQGARLKRNQDYMVEVVGSDYYYWFLDAQWALMFQLASAGLLQQTQAPGHRFDIECPHCHGVFDRKDIVWR